MAQTNTFYDLEQLKSIPILEVCQTFGIPTFPKGNKVWCKLREEKEPSALLHVENNTFYDFGLSNGGDTIALVSSFLDIDRKSGIERLASAFGIEARNPRQGFASDALTDWEYSQIGLYGDLATKNFTFDLGRQSVERVSQLSSKYAMPMNELKKKHPQIFGQLLRDKALPFVRAMRNEYYLEIFSRYSLLKEMGNKDPHLDPDCIKLMDPAEQIEKLRNAERILSRACEKTAISPRPVGEYEVSSDLKKILAGEIRPDMGTTDYFGIQKAAKQQGTSIKYQTVDYGKYMASGQDPEASPGLDSFVHSAFLKEGKVIVGYLECDRAAIKPLLDEMKISAKKNLDEQISQAQKQVAAGSDGLSKQRTFLGEDR